MIYKVSAGKNIFKGYYFWYLARSLSKMYNLGVIDLELREDKFPKFTDNAYLDHIAVIYINDFPIYLDMFDTAKFWYEDIIKEEKFIIFKANRSEEILSGAVKCPYELNEFTLSNKDKIMGFAYGRVFNLPFDIDEFTYFDVPDKKKYNIVSYNGPGWEDLHTESRIKVYDCISSVSERNKLVYRSRADIVSKYDKEMSAKYPEVFTGFPQLKEYYGFISSGKFSLNTPGIGLSQPGKIVDGVLSKTAIVSTIIYQDIYKDFPCVKLPVCGYYGTGDWEKAAEIIKDIDLVDVKSMYKDSLLWYDKYLSAEGLWKNQLLKAYERGIE